MVVVIDIEKVTRTPLGLKTPRGSTFKNNHVHSIYKKGKIREERINREDIVEVSQVTIEELK